MAIFVGGIVVAAAACSASIVGVYTLVLAHTPDAMACQITYLNAISKAPLVMGRSITVYSFISYTFALAHHC